MTEIKYAIRAHNPADLSSFKFEVTDKQKSHEHALRLYGNGYNVIVTRVTREQIAEWKQGGPTT